MKLLFIILVVFLSLSSHSYEISKAVFEPIKETKRFFKAKALVQNIPFGPVSKVRIKLEEELGLNLKNRGEAHITFLTPPEYKKHFKGHFNIHELYQFVKNEIQDVDFKIRCVGSLSKGQNQTFYIVVESPKLLRLREELAQKLGKIRVDHQFRPEQFYPHITLGFTDRDLHHAAKDIGTCLGNIQVVEN